HSIAIFEDFDAGDYKVLIEGPEPLQRAVMNVAILAESEKTLPIAFDAYKLAAKVLFEDKPFTNADVELMESLWKSRVKTDEQGRFEAQLWSPVELGVLVSGGSLREPFGTMLRAAANDNQWTIEVPSRKISGRVIDASTRKAIAKAKLHVESDDGSIRFSRIAFADDEGNYEISAVPPATFQIDVQAAGYLPSEPTELRLTRDERERRFDFALTRGERLNLIVRDLRGVPLRDALLAEASSSDPARIVRLLRTDDDGIASTIAAEKSVNLIYAMPREGSLAVTPVVAVRDDKPVEIRVAPAAGTLRVRAERMSGEPLGGLAVTMRMNGQTLPYSVVRQFAMLNGGSTVTMPDGELALPKLPAAMYELCLGAASRCSKPGATWVNVALSGDTRVTVRVE
ncbi:MAG TPA: carboxypeptidase-like regulatory domain-containing protein, partial [Thermoanaerobaculia bacterium]|nr:carboxypeptidase-like regulatory domain-containing protein [Thermoanaerobaculia bacterium]